jgi:hypothetical protein
MKNVTKLAWWWWDSFSINTMNWGNCDGCIVVVDVPVDCAVAEVLYLRWFLCGRLISDDAAEIVMVGECWRSMWWIFTWYVVEKNVTHQDST